MIDRKTLVEQVQNTAPYLSGAESTTVLEASVGGAVRGVPLLASERYGYVAILNEWEKTEHPSTSFYQLCISAHFATVGTFVPTDVDLAIRQKLWYGIHNSKTFEPQWRAVQEFKKWDESLVSARWQILPSGKKLSGHQGEWFSIAMGAYGCALKVAPDFIPEIRQSIEELVKEHESALTEAKAAFLGAPTVESAKVYFDGVASIAHNLGDLDRMFEIWEIPDTDVLKRRVFRSGHEDARSPRPVLIEGGVIYQAMLANENHRHFSLRDPKGLRKSQKFLLNYGPFLDDWGARIIREGWKDGLIDEGDVREIIEALVLGWKRLNAKSMYHSQGYSRALAGMMSVLPRGREDLESLVPPVIRKELVEGGLRTLTAVSKKQFETQWVAQLKKRLNSS